MSYREYWKEQNAEVEERNSLVFGRIQEIITETSVEELYQDYFSKAATRIANVEKIYSLWETDGNHRQDSCFRSAITFACCHSLVG